MSRLFAASSLRFTLGAALIVSGSLSIASPAMAQKPADPVLATVNGQPIHMSDLQELAQSLPQARGMPPQQLYPLLMDRIIDGKALLIAAQKAGLDKDPTVQHAMQEAADQALEGAFLRKTITAQITEEALHARYDQEFANKKGETEVHARHILVADEATAKKIIAELKKGGDFAALSTQYSKDPGASQQGGDLGWFKKDDMVPEFSAVAFSLKDNEIAPTPVKTQFGYHVIQVLGHRQAQPPSFEEERDTIRQAMVQAAIQDQITAAKADVKIERFNMDGSPAKATDTAEPPAAK